MDRTAPPRQDAAMHALCGAYGKLCAMAARSLYVEGHTREAVEFAAHGALGQSAPALRAIVRQRIIVRERITSARNEGITAAAMTEHCLRVKGIVDSEWELSAPVSLDAIKLR